MAVKTRWILFAVLVFILSGVITFVIFDNQSIFNGDRVKNPDCYTLRFSKMNQEDSHTLSLHAGDVLSVDFAIDRGNVDLLIGIPGKEPVYKGNKIDTGAFDVTVPEDGSYKIGVSAKRASGYIAIYAQGGTDNESVGG